MREADHARAGLGPAEREGGLRGAGESAGMRVRCAEVWPAGVLGGEQGAPVSCISWPLWGQRGLRCLSSGPPEGV